MQKLIKYACGGPYWANTGRLDNPTGLGHSANKLHALRGKGERQVSHKLLKIAPSRNLSSAIKKTCVCYDSLCPIFNYRNDIGYSFLGGGVCVFHVLDAFETAFLRAIHFFFLLLSTRFWGNSRRNLFVEIKYSKQFNKHLNLVLQNHFGLAHPPKFLCTNILSFSEIYKQYCFKYNCYFQKSLWSAFLSCLTNFSV